MVHLPGRFSVGEVFFDEKMSTFANQLRNVGIWKRNYIR